MPSFAFKCVYFRNRKQTSSIALHCFWASFSRQSNEPRDSTHFDSILLILNLRHSSLRWDSLIVTQFHFEANSGFGEPTANGDSCIWRVWWLGWCTEEEEDHGLGISLWGMRSKKKNLHIWGHCPNWVYPPPLLQLEQFAFKFFVQTWALGEKIMDMCV